MNKAPYRIIGYHPDVPGLYLISAEAADTPEIPEDMIETAQVLDTKRGVLFPPATLMSLCVRDPWQRYEGDQSLLADLLKQVKPFEPDQ